ncbi:MAG: S41 family peptidase [Bacteroidales bacterium]
MKKVFIIMVAATLAVSSCKKDEITPVVNNTLNAKARDALNDLMNDWYYWYKELPTVTLSDYKDPYELLDALRYKKYDRWSFVEDYTSYVSSMQGTFVGHGIRIGLSPDNKTRIVMIYKNSPMYALGVRRGWIIKKLNGTELAPVFIAKDWTQYGQLIGASTTGVENTFLFQTPRGNDTTIVTKKSSFQVNSVTYYDTLNLKSGKTGYLVFDEFITPSSEELKTAFSFFKQNNTTDLILDLRYNSGGLVSVAVELASYIAGLPTTSVLVKSDFNDKKASNNESTFFKTMQYPLNMSRVVIISTRETASASEIIVNGLKPYMNVVLVGDTTNGKPTGMNVWSYQNKFIFAPITFKLVNSQNQGDFFGGFAPNKYVIDDITHDFGDRREYCLREAISYMETGAFTSKGAYVYSPVTYRSERPEWMKNAFFGITTLKDKSRD